MSKNLFSVFSSKKTTLFTIFLLCLCVGQSYSAIYNAPCEIDEDCQEIYTESYKCYSRHCMRRYFRFNFQEIMGSFVVIAISMIANAGGLGAGAVIIPIYMFMFDFVATDSIPLSKITIFAGALVNFVFNWDQRHMTDKNRFMINYNMASIMIPLLLAGTMVGVILSKFLPPLVITGGLITYLSLSILKLYKRGMKMHKKELSEQLLQDSMSHDATEMKETRKSDGQVEQFEQEGYTFERDDNQELTTGQMIKTQLTNFGSILLSFIVVLVTALVRGGEGKESILGIKECTAESWITFLASQFLCLVIAISSYRANAGILDKEDELSGETDLDNARKQRNHLLVASYFTGVAAGTLGIGGGMILGPFMLAMNMNPMISTALSAFTVLFTSSSTTLQFTIAGAIHFSHAWLFMSLSLIGSLIGIFLLKALIRKYNKPSILIWVIFGILVLAGVVLPCQMIYTTVRNPSRAMSFGKLC